MAVLAMRRVAGRRAVVVFCRAGYVRGRAGGAGLHTMFPLGVGWKGGCWVAGRRWVGVVDREQRRRCGVKEVPVVFAAGQDGLEWSRLSDGRLLGSWPSVAQSGKAAPSPALPSRRHACEVGRHSHVWPSSCTLPSAMPQSR